MPIIKSAIKKLRADRKKQLINKSVKSKAINLMGAFRKKPEKTGLAAVFSALDKAAKTNVFHRRKADRLKARLSKMVAK